MSKILIIYSSVHGQTRKICECLQKKFTALGDEVVISNLAESPDLVGFDKILLGASIRHGKHNPSVYDFITQHRAILDAKITGFFSVSLVARKPAKNRPETNPYMLAFIEKSEWQPNVLQVFAGNLNYQGYSAVDRNIIRFIMWLTKGPTDAYTNVEYTDWDKVDGFSREFSGL
ncbi:menaquinone-dependent protoporphyrinogen IX dehydrogenase [Shewanella sp. D64]|uniref:menaquinone-dependent protoporphyrinogen IX dehydrogenase n=1 Tax=unclassified Shewanella TaxID=196818 RepID=UPI0022BA2D01|nr:MULTISPECIES: menaquinone-dependent protoporphyrinogen IX dehydrogenase [unclassified Shewanella]MEC4727479.1 menaquinone-dependent protoporphyrinogen IX dehydrogenase [Shewanella sp. D64]MEC4738112.1 menaquinone-dependent protoporphyrinogen IX dehydrogenase [Shewanella sp. E94]WBJ96374.1 menaquinone-dependent protoporphyrinogen IX dehydrogenase [Shewanella sp. MTB7]